jgi:hypothetical protein
MIRKKETTQETKNSSLITGLLLSDGQVKLVGTEYAEAD